MRQTHSFVKENNQSKESKVYFVPKPKEGLGIDSMGEFAASFDFSHQFVNDKGQPVSFIHIAQTLLQALDTLPNC